MITELLPLDDHFREGVGGGWGNMRDPVNEVVLDEDNIEKNAGLG